MNRAFSTREKVLLLVLAAVLLGCLYYLFVLTPAQQLINNAKNQVDQLETELSVQQTMAEQKEIMREELAEKKASGAASRKTLKYDSSDVIMKELDGILAGAKTYSVTFADPEVSEDGSTVRHGVNISFTASSYASAKDLVEQLVNSKYSSLITDFSLSAGDAAGTSAPANGAVNIVYYETK